MENEKITLFVKIVAKGEKTDLVKTELLKLRNSTRTEDGCINIDLHQNNQNENIFWIYENWESRELMQIHRQSAHLAEYIKATNGAVQEFLVNEMKEIE